MGTYTGTSRADTILPGSLTTGVQADPPGTTPSAATDIIGSLGGADEIDGGGGADAIDGGSGNDGIVVRGTGSTVQAGDGSDTVFVQYCASGEPEGAVTRFYGGGGNDGLGGHLEWDSTFRFPDVTLYAYGGSGNDQLGAPTVVADTDVTYSVGKNFLSGGPGNDGYLVYDASDAIIERPGEGYDDVVTFASYTLSANVEQLELIATWDNVAVTGIGNEQDNVIIGGEVGNTIEGRGGHDTLYGAGFGYYQDMSYTDADVIRGGAGNDLIYGGTGNPADNWDAADELYGDDGNDRIFAQFGDDQLYGGAGDDELAGQAGNDVLIAGEGNDRLGGGTGNDRLYGQGGGDILTGRAGMDRLYGEGGNDRFVYEAVDDSLANELARDKIIGFGNAGAAKGDIIDLSSIDADATRAGNQAFAFVGTQAPAKAGQLAVVDAGTDTLIRGEVNGTP